MTLRQFIEDLAVCVVFLMFAACSPASEGKGDKKPVTLHLFTWSDYTEETAAKEFEQKFGIKVVTDTFGSNDELLA